jgi:hypothetical protein
MASDPLGRHSHFMNWPKGCTIDEPEVRYILQVDGVSTTWVEVERIAHPSAIEGLPGSDRNRVPTTGLGA